MTEALDPAAPDSAPALAGSPLEPLGDRRWGGIELAANGPESRIRLWGDVDATLREQAGLVMAEVVLRSGAVVVDASEVGFIDSTGLAFVLQLVRVGEEEGLEVVLQDPPPHVMDLVHLIGMGERIAVRRTTSAVGDDGGAGDARGALDPVV